ncbi:MAG: DUF2490 domain-containing protein [Gammaproteobacteria bacterium]
MKRLVATLALSLTSMTPALAETIEQHSGWAGWFNSVRLNEHWGLFTDAQVRSGDDLEEVQNVLLRPGVTYFHDEQNNFTLGYAWVATLNNPGDNLVEHRIWQQYVHTQSWQRAALTHRFRFEQRFVEPASGGDRLFSQRARYMFRSVIPLKTHDPSFKSGPFLALQNEIFLNVQHKENVNGKLFDQNRAFLGAGYRLSPEYDLEVAYINQYVDGRARNTMNHIVQLGLYSRF